MRILHLLLLGLGACGDGLNPAQLLPSTAGGRCTPGPAGGCPSAPLSATQVCSSGRGGWTVSIPAEARYAELTIGGGETGVAAAAIDWDARDGKDDLAGLVLATGPGSPPRSLEDPIAASLATATGLTKAGFYKSVALVSSGYRPEGGGGPSRLGAATVLEARQGSTAALYTARNPLFPLLTSLDLDLFRDLPTAPTESSDAFVLSYALALRAEGTVLIGSVATKASFQSRLGKAGIRALDLADGSGLSLGSGAELKPGCFDATLPSGFAPRVDLIFAIQAADSLSDRRIALHQAAASFWSRARAAGLDLRIAVVDLGQHSPASAVGLCRPKGCAGPFFVEGDSGLACLQECLLSPSTGSGSAAPGDGRQGVESARRTLLSMLPRTVDGDPTRIRAEAQVALLIVSDEEDAGLAELFPSGVPEEPQATAREQIDRHLAPLRDLLRGEPNPVNELPTGSTSDALRGSVVHALVPFPLGERAPSSPCALRRGVAYRRLAAANGGFFGDLCLEDYDLFLELLVQDLAARAGGRGLLGLGRLVAGSSLSGSLDGNGLFRSIRQGFTYGRAGNGLVFFDLASRLQGAAPHRLELGHASF